MNFINNSGMIMFNSVGMIIAAIILARWVAIGKLLEQSEVFSIIAILFMMGFNVNSMTFWAMINF